MADFERTAIVPVGPDQAFQYLSNPANLPKYVSMMIMARPESQDRLHVAAEVEGRHEEGEAHFRTNAGERRMEWGGEGDAHYRGSLQVQDSGEGTSVKIEIHTGHEHDASEIERALDETVSNIEQQLRATM